MLKQKPLELDGKIVSIKFTNGEEIMAYCVSSDPLTVKNPLSLVLGARKDTEKAHVAFTPWMLSISHNSIVGLKHENIAVITQAGPDATSQYNEAAKSLSTSV